MQIDVVVLTKNSERMLEECLNSIYENVPVNRLIVVDGYSTDKTVEIVEKFKRKYGNVILIQEGGTRGAAREKGIKEVITDWFMFVDSDVVLCDKWFEKARKYMEKDEVGAIWGIEVWHGMKNSKVLKLFLWITRKIFEIRGGTHDILIKLEAVKNMKIPKELHVFEDAYIKEWIAKQGYKIVACYNPYCIHYRPDSVWTLKGSLKLVSDYLKNGSLKLVLKLLPPYSFYAVYSLYRNLATKIKL
ncbi:hypothetical protein DRO54_04570 [Candidatus Bathyarchaeota archaeon]|nr:MAG: hypothetical protein DRO54_04570 [Candidatus Bathyarchaeota archaeon]